jgi:diguanylate cyclase (GGDEF)-like protein
MAGQDKTPALLHELGHPGDRAGRAEWLARALRIAILLLDADAAAVVFDASRKRGERLVLFPGSPEPALLPQAPAGSEALRLVARSRQPLAVPDLLDQPELAAGDACPGLEAGPAVFIPLSRRDAQPAYLAAYRRRGRARFSATETQLMILLGAWLATSLDRLRLAAGRERLCLSDELTGTYNARFLRTALKREVRRANRFGQECSLVLFGFDSGAFAVDAGGAPDPVVAAAATAWLREAAGVLAAQVRGFDLLGRLEDGSFLLLLPQTGRDGAHEAAERMRAALEAHAFAATPTGPPEVCCGVACFPHDGPDAEALLSVAGRALEHSRRHGNGPADETTRQAA